MKVVRSWHSRRRGMAGIVATVFMFAMLFTVGASYFLFVNQNNMLYSEAASQRASVAVNQHGESLTIVGYADPNTGAMSFTAENLGAATATVTGFFVSTAGAVVAFCQHGTGGSCPTLPTSVNPGVTSGDIAMGVTFSSSNTYIISVVTQLGNVFTATYPPTATNLATQALASGAIADLYLSFDSYTWYTALTTGCPVGSYNGVPYSAYCLSSASGNSGSGFAIPSAKASPIGFSVTLTNLNAGKADIVLDQFTLIYEDQFHGSGQANFITWYLGNVGPASGNKIPILSRFSPVVLQWNTPTTLYFVSSTCIQAATGPNDGCNPLSSQSFGGGSFTAGQVTNVFILSNGWKEASGTYTIGQLSYGVGSFPVNYGQNSPFVSTLYY